MNVDNRLPVPNHTGIFTRGQAHLLVEDVPAWADQVCGHRSIHSLPQLRYKFLFRRNKTLPVHRQSCLRHCRQGAVPELPVNP
ncbi:hypothetical protein D3C81_2060090 [compost metagenome]